MCLLQQEKAAKKEAKFKAKKQQSLSLQEFLTSPSESSSAQGEKVPTEEVESEGGGGGANAEGEMATQEGKEEVVGKVETGDSIDEYQQPSADKGDLADVSASPSEDHDIDPATGESKTVAMVTGQQDVVVEGQRSYEQDGQEPTFQDYASSGPQPDPNELTELLGGLRLDDNDASVHAGEEEEQAEGKEAGDDDGDPGATPTATPTTALKELYVQNDSVEGSLKRFCTPELLTGSNKFACDVCTKGNNEISTCLEEEKIVERNESEVEKNLTGAARKEDSEESEKAKADDGCHVLSASVSEIQMENETDSHDSSKMVEATQTEEATQVEEGTQTEKDVREESVGTTDDGERDHHGDDVATTPLSEVPLDEEEPGSVLSPSSMEQKTDESKDEEELLILEEKETEGK